MRTQFDQPPPRSTGPVRDSRSARTNREPYYNRVISRNAILLFDAPTAFDNVSLASPTVTVFFKWYNFCGMIALK